MTKNCYCCNKEFLHTAQEQKYIFCNDCAKKVKKEIHKLRRKENPFTPWKWNSATLLEVVEITKKLQNEN